MNDKQQMSAMGEHMAEQAGQAQPMCMAKRIEELEAQVRVMAGALNDFREFAAANVWDDGERESLLASIDATLSGNLPTPSAPDGWQLVPVEPTENMISESIDAGGFDEDDAVFFWASMLAAAPKLEEK